jgi:chitodextrinase
MGNTAYDLYLRNDCSDSANGFSGWVGPFTFVTNCNAFTAPYSNNFDSDSLDAPPICWANYIVGGTSTTAIAAEVEAASTFNPAISSPNYVRMYNFNADTTMLRTPEFSDMPNDSNRISFFARTTTTATTGNEIVVGTIDGADNWSSFDAFDTITLTNVYQQFFVDITAANGYNGTDTYIVLEHAGSTFRTFYIDDFVYEKIPLCNPPLITSMGNSFATATTGDVFWGAGSDGDATRIEWGLQGYTPGSPIGSDTVGGVVDTFLITGLSPQTTYDVYIQDSCSGDGLSPYVGPITIKTACAITSPAVLPIVDGFENYTSGPTFSDVEFFCNPGYYFEFTPGPNNGRARLQAGTGYYNNGSQAFTMDQSSFMSGGATNFLTMTVDLSSYTNSGGIELSFYFMNHGQPVHPDNKVWVRGAAGDSWIEILDLNLLSSGTGTYDSVQGVDILAPITANGQSIGTNTQIRFGQHGTTLSSSVSFSDGYTFDDISLEAVSCAKPSGLAAANLIDTAATLSWNASQSASQTQYWFGPGGFFQGTLTAGGVQAFTSGSSVLVDTLSPETCYEFLVRNVCAPGDTSDWAGPFLFCTPCAAISANYYENFDGLTAGLDLGCFNKIEDPALAQSAFQGVVINTSSFNQAFTPPSVVELDNSNLTSSTLALVSPLTNDLDDGNKRLRFRARSTSTFNTRELHIGTTNDPASGVVNRFDTVTLTTSMDEYIVELTPANGYNGTDMYFVIEHGNLSTFQTIYVDDVNYERIPTCFRPSGVQVSSITSTSASVSWTAAGSGTNFQIEYGINPLGDPNNTRVLNTGTTASLASLIPGTGYCVWVREICTPGDTSFWEGPICFSTLCPTSYSAPYFTNFENISIGTGSGSPAGWDNCWTTTSTSGLRWESEDASGANENSLNTGPFFDNTLNGTPGGTYMYLETSFGGTSEDLISPGIDIATVSNPELEFHYHMFGATINKLIVYAEDANGNRTNLDSIGGQQQVAGSDSFRVRTVSLAGLTPGVYNFIFEGHRGTSFTGDIAIDDVSVQAGASCPAPNNLRQTAATLSSIDVAWNAPASATSWEIEYGPVGFSQGAGTIVAVTTNPYTITGLSSATSYDFYVREICTPGDTSTWAGPATVATDLCSPSSQCMYALQLDDTFGDGWNGAEIKVLQNNVEVGTFGSTFTTGSQFIDSVALCNGLATSIVLDPAGSWPSEIGVTVIDRFGVPIDSFVAGGLAPTTGDTLISFTPICGFPCASPTGISVTNNVGCDSVEVDWTSNSGGSLIEYGVSGFTPGTGTLTGIVTPPYTITGLSPNTAYDIWIADTCTNDTSTFEQLTATTASGPMPVAAFTIDSAIVNGAYQIYVDASPSVAADNYQWTFGNGITSSTIADTVSYATNGSYTITLIVTNACGSDTATFVTNANVGLVDNQLAGSLNVYPNPADDLVNLSFSVVGSAQAEIRILDMQGREVWRATETAQGARFNAQVDVSEFAAGVYMVEINSAGIQARRRVSIR